LRQPPPEGVNVVGVNVMRFGRVVIHNGIYNRAAISWQAQTYQVYNEVTFIIFAQPPHFPIIDSNWRTAIADF
jgi:hypothetical protein